MVRVVKMTTVYEMEASRGTPVHFICRSACENCFWAIKVEVVLVFLLNAVKVRAEYSINIVYVVEVNYRPRTFCENCDFIFSKNIVF